MNGLDTHGLLLMNKPRGWSSHDMVSFLRKRLKISSVGHCGTLDPEAEGLLVMLVGEGTKLSQYLLEKDKSYEFEARLGLETSSFDLDGEVLRDEPVEFPVSQIQQAGELLQGEFDWPVPRFSAKKVQGQKLCDRARRGEEFEPPRKLMKFYDFKLESIEGREVRGQISCSKGSYIRTWVNELGKALGCGATLTKLVRTRSEPYRLQGAVSPEILEKAVGEGAWPQGAFIPLTEALPGWPHVRALGESERLLKNGQISGDLKAQLIRQHRPGSDSGVLVLDREGRGLAMVGNEAGKGFVLRRVFRY